MNTHGDSLFGHVRSKLRHSRSSVMLQTSIHTQPQNSSWDNVPLAYRPVEREDVRIVDGYYLNRPLPGPPPRPRTTSPTLLPDGRTSIDMGKLRNPTPRTHRTRSAELAQRRWSGLDENDSEAQNKRASVNLAIALPPDHLDPPPPYSRYPDATSLETQSRPRSQPPPAHPAHFVKPYDPNDYVWPQSRGMSMPVEHVPTIATPQPPTPVSPLNTLDYQYLAMRHPPATESNVTIDGLLTHPMLQHR